MIPGTSTIAQSVKLPLVMSAVINEIMVQDTTTLPPIYISTNAPGKILEDNPNTWAPATEVEDSNS